MNTEFYNVRFSPFNAQVTGISPFRGVSLSLSLSLSFFLSLCHRDMEVFLSHLLDPEAY
jgi:hypothetical protein